jgi:hypothetical protein
VTAEMPQTQTPPPDSKHHRARIAPGVPCGCYFCLTAFDGGTVAEWTDAGETALCPRCGIDAVVPGETRIEALVALHERWFCQGTDGIPDVPQRAPRVFIDMDGVIVDFAGYAEQVGLPGVELKKVPGAYRAMAPIPGAIEAVRELIARGYEVWIATKPPTGVAGAYSEKAAWIFEYLPELSHRLVITHDKGFLGDADDFLIDDRPHKANCESFAGTLLPFVDGMTWALVLERLVAPVKGILELPVPA